MFYNIQYLRYLAAMLVVLDHTFQIVPRDGRGDLGGQFEVGAAGVDIFFSISGFIMVIITENRERNTVDFFLHRLIRVAPSYWIVTFVMAALIILLPSVFHTSKFHTDHFIASIFFVAWPNGTMLGAVPLYMPGWTLNYEFLFYSVFALALLVSRDTFRVFLTSAVLISLAIIGYLVPFSSPIAKFYTHTILIEFVFGMFIGLLVSKNLVLGKFFGATFLALGAIGLTAAALFHPVARISLDRFIYWGIPGALMVAGAVFLDIAGGTRNMKLLRLLGDASYAIYLTHYFVVGFIGQLWHRFHLSKSASDFWMIAACFVITSAVGVGFHIFLERPITSRLKKSLGFISSARMG